MNSYEQTFYDRLERSPDLKQRYINFATSALNLNGGETRLTIDQLADKLEHDFLSGLYQLKNGELSFGILCDLCELAAVKNIDFHTIAENFFNQNNS